MNGIRFSITTEYYDEYGIYDSVLRVYTSLEAACNHFSCDHTNAQGGNLFMIHPSGRTLTTLKDVLDHTENSNVITNITFTE